MDKIILLILLSTIGSVTKGNAQLHCFVCSNCPNGNQLDRNLIRSCEAPDDPDTTTTPEDTTTTPEDTTTTDNTPPVTTQTTPSEPPSTTEQTPEDTTTTQTSDGGVTTQTTPIVPPSTTTQEPGIPPSKLKHKYRQIMQDLVGQYQCFVIRRQVGNEVHVNRGCVITQSSREQTCLDAGAETGSCDLCAYNECNVTNSAAKYSLSLAVILSFLFVILAIR